MKYKEGYDYQLVEDEITQTRVHGFDITTDWIRLTPNGVLTRKKGYAWDGATWFPDIKSIFRASLVHDALYQLLREELLPQSMRIEADRELIAVANRKGMWKITQKAVWVTVRSLGASAASPSNVKPILTAP